MMDSVLITGGSGFLGEALVARLLWDGCRRVCVYSRGEHRQAEMREGFSDSRVRWFIGDVRDAGRLERAMHGCKAVIHAAALKRIEVGAYNPCEMVKTNVDGTINVIEAVRKSGVERALLISSDKAYEPISPYGQTKALAESLFLAANVQGGPKFAAVRYGNVAGSTGSVIPAWKKPDPFMTSADCTRFYMTRGDAVSLVLKTLDAMVGGEVAIPTLPAFRLGDLAEAMGVNPKVIGLRAFEKMHEGMAPGNTSDVARRMTVSELHLRIEEIK